MSQMRRQKLQKLASREHIAHETASSSCCLQGTRRSRGAGDDNERSPRWIRVTHNAGRAAHHLYPHHRQLRPALLRCGLPRARQAFGIQPKCDAHCFECSSLIRCR